MMPERTSKAEGAFLTIGELADDLGIQQHILRYWETRFPQLKPLQRSGNRRYYRPADVALAQEIHRLLYQDGYTVKGVQKLLASRGGSGVEAKMPAVTFTTVPDAVPASRVAAHPPLAHDQTLAMIRARLSSMLSKIDASLG